MAFHLFAKKVRNEELCFVRDIIELGAAIADVTSIPVMRSVILKIINKYNLEDRLNEVSENGHYIIEDCYPYDNTKKMNYARELLNARKEIPLNDEEKEHVLYAALKCVEKMNFSYQDKVTLIRECLFEPTGNDRVDNLIIEQYLPLL